MASYEFGIYILTYPGDYHLSSILVRNIQQVSPSLPIMLIPGEESRHINLPVVAAAGPLSHSPRYEHLSPTG